MTVSLDTLHRTNFETLPMELAVSSRELYLQAAKTSKVAGLRIKLVMATLKDFDSNIQTKIQFFDCKSFENLHQLRSSLAIVSQSAQEFVRESKIYGIHIFLKIWDEKKHILATRGCEITNAENMDTCMLLAILQESSKAPEPNLN